MKNNRGFSLILFSVGVAVASLIAIALINYYPSEKIIARSQETIAKMNSISTALTGFVSQNGRLPCPASPTDNMRSATFGKESRSSTFVCNAINVMAPSSSPKHYSGAIPVQTLGLPTDYMFDGWGNKIEYVVSPSLYVAPNENITTNFTSTNASLIVRDDNNNNLNTTAAFVLISRGKNGYGAYRADSSTRSGFPPLSKPAERENLECQPSSASCSVADFNNIYKFSSTLNSDDLILYKDKSEFMLICSKNFSSPFCKTVPCVNTGAVTYWKDAAKIVDTFFQESILISKQSPLPYLDLTSAIKVQSDSYTLKLKLQSLSTFHGNVTLFYQYALRSAPSTLINSQIGFFSTDIYSGNYSSSHVGTYINIPFGSSNQIPKKLYFIVNTTASDAQIKMNITDTQIIYPNANQNNKVNYQIWDNLNGNSVMDLLTYADYPNAANSSTTLTSTKGYTNYAKKYGNKMWGYITPTQSGTYTFYMDSGGNEVLFLSTDYTEGNKVMMVAQNGGKKGKGKYPGYSVGSVNLVAGTSYYFEVINKQQGGSNYFEIAWDGPGIVNGPIIIASPYLSTAPKNIITSPPVCNSFFRFTADLSPAQSQQPANIINLKNAFGRYIKISLNSNQPTTTGMNPAQDMYLLREIRFRDINNQIISPSVMKIYKYSSSYALQSDYLSYTPNYLIDAGSITASTTFSSVSDINNTSKKGWLTQNVSKPQYLIFDLGATYQLKDVLIWNGNQLYTLSGKICCPGRSVKNVTISVSDDINHLLYNAD